MTDNKIELLREAVDEISISNSVSNDLASISECIAKDLGSYKSFIDKLSLDVKEGERKDFVQFAENCKLESMTPRDFLSENTSSNMSTFAVIDSLILKEIWNRLGARAALSYKVLQQPYIQIPFLKQFMKDPATGNLVDIPEMLTSESFRGKEAKITFDGLADVNNAANRVKNAFTENSIADAATQGLTLNGFGEFYEFHFHDAVNAGGQAADPVSQVVTANTEGMFKADITFYDKTNSKNVTETIIGWANRKTGDVSIMSVKGLLNKALYRVKISQEMNKFTFNIEHKLEKEMVTVGDGDTINSGMPVQYLQDLKALFQLDAVTEMSNVMSRTFATIYDMEVYQTIADSIKLPDQTISFDASMYVNPNGGNDKVHIGISRQIHNASLMDRIIRGIALIDSRFNFNGAMEYYVIANPIEASILSGVIAPEYSGTIAQGGSLKPYTAGQVVGKYESGDIRVITSKHYAKGSMYICPKSSIDSEVVAGYYDYSQVLMPMGAYRNEDKQLIPNIFMNKRKTIKVFRPTAFQKIEVANSTLE